MGLRIVVLGQGAWGSTLASRFASQGHRISSWSRRQGGGPAMLLAEADLVVVAIAMAGVGALAEQLGPGWRADLPLISCTKGIDLKQLCTPSQIWGQRLDPQQLVVLSGPNLAAELDQGLPAASVLASADAGLATRLQHALSDEVLRFYTNADPIGTEVSGALKNVMAVAAGVCDGLGLGANAKASLLCRGLKEMGVVLAGLGGQATTLYGLAGLGDLLATANSTLSRNYRFGLLLAEGLSAEAARERIGATVEGPATARAVQSLAVQHGWGLPICEQVVGLVEGRVGARACVRALMGRDLTEEQR
jgi:glycerol-3-phosphate dehydrogenase (NAD(P)+)